MQSVGEADARDILARLRSGTDVQTLVNQVESGDLLLQLSVAPETRFRYDFPYNKRMPVGLATDNNAYLRAPIYAAACLHPSSAQSNIEKETPCRGNTGLISDSVSHSQGAQPIMDESLYLMPYHAANVVDARLSSVKISSWTSVCDDDVLMRDILGRWLQCEYHFTAAFQKDLFLEDMILLREDFCSSLLVNVTLGYACV